MSALSRFRNCDCHGSDAAVTTGALTRGRQREPASSALLLPVSADTVHDECQTPESDVELLGLGVVSTVFERFSPAERRRALAFLTDRYGEEQS